MKKTNKIKTWTLEHRFGEITFEFSKSIDIHEVLAAMKAANTEKDSWLESLCDKTADTITIGWGLDSGVFPDAIPEICKAVAETFSDTAFKGNAIFDDNEQISCFYYRIKAKGDV